MCNCGELQNLNRKYVRRQLRLNPDNGQERFNNCLVFRLKLYNLRDPLLSFIERKFNGLIRLHRLRHESREVLLERILGNVRTHLVGLNSQDIVFIKEEGERRKRFIQRLVRNQVDVNWKILASFYTGNFLFRKDVFNVEDESDTKDLLEVLKNCCLFEQELYDLATIIIRYRNKYYAHIPELFIRTRQLQILETSIQELEHRI